MRIMARLENRASDPSLFLTAHEDEEGWPSERSCIFIFVILPGMMFGLCKAKHCLTHMGGGHMPAFAQHVSITLTMISTA